MLSAIFRWVFAGGAGPLWVVQLPKEVCPEKTSGLQTGLPPNSDGKVLTPFSNLGILARRSVGVAAEHAYGVGKTISTPTALLQYFCH